MPTKVSKTAVIVIVCVILGVVAITLGIVFGVSASKVKTRARASNIPLVELQDQQHLRRVPKNRVKDSAIPAGMKRTIVSNYPLLDVIHDFLTPEEADHVIKLADNRFKRSVVIDFKTGKHIANRDRTSSTVFLDRSEDEIIKTIEEKAAKMAGVPSSYLERLQVVRYEPGQFYKAHHDYIHGSTKEVREHGQRTVTIFVYLNDLPDDEPGGGTRFPYLKQTIRPSKGKAALWHNMTPSSHVDPRTLHAGEPVQKSVKYGANIWFRDRPQQ